jgi:hypothetical protein
MKRDLFIISVAMLAIGLATWSFWGNPEAVSRVHTAQSLNQDPGVKLVTERSDYMRTER